MTSANDSSPGMASMPQQQQQPASAVSNQDIQFKDKSDIPHQGHKNGNDTNFTHGIETNEEEEEEDEEEEDILTEELEKVGRSVSFNMSQMLQIPSFKLFSGGTNSSSTSNNDIQAASASQQDLEKSISDLLLEEQIRAIFNKRSSQFSDFVNDLTSGFSLQYAADRLQALRDVVQSTVELPVSSDEEGDDEIDKKKEYEPHGVIAVAKTEKQIPIIDELIIPTEDKPSSSPSAVTTATTTTGRPRNKSLSKYIHLTNLTHEEFKDEKFLRSRIKNIMSLPNIPDRYKHDLIQKLMMKSYYERLKDGGLQNPDDKDEVKLSKKGGEEEQYDDEDDEDEDEDEDQSDDEVILTKSDLKPSYHSVENEILGCEHYKRNCKIECNICHKWYPCRFCHDAEIKDHHLPRAQTKHVLCMFCLTPQIPSHICANDDCGKILSHYFCEKCVLFDNDTDKDIYHCDDCGICRLGQGLNEDFFHCKGCNACISIDLQDHHKCIENSTHSNCTICGEYMFNSIKTVVLMQCGHPIHQSCFDEYTKHSYKCPVCSRSIINMEAQFRVLDQEISLQPLPEPYGSWKSIVQCNDCKAKSMVKYHILGLKCENCKSFNTTQMKVLKNEKDVKEFETKHDTHHSKNKLHNHESFTTPTTTEIATNTAAQHHHEPKHHVIYSHDDEEEEEEEDDLEFSLENFKNMIKKDTVKNFERYREWFFNRMDFSFNQTENDNSSKNNNDDDNNDNNSKNNENNANEIDNKTNEDQYESYEEDDYDDMR